MLFIIISYSQLPKIINGTPLIRTGWSNSCSAFIQPNNAKNDVSPSLPLLSIPVASPDHRAKSKSFTHPSMVVNNKHQQQSFMTKVTSVPRVTVSRSSSHRKMKYVLQKSKHNQDSNFLDVESVKTSSMSSLSTYTTSHYSTKKISSKPATTDISAMPCMYKHCYDILCLLISFSNEI